MNPPPPHTLITEKVILTLIPCHGASCGSTSCKQKKSIKLCIDLPTVYETVNNSSCFVRMLVHKRTVIGVFGTDVLFESPAAVTVTTQNDCSRKLPET